MIFSDPEKALSGRYPREPARLSHTLRDRPEFKVSALLGLSRVLDAGSIEYNAGDLPLEQDPDTTPMNGLSVEETIARIAECRSWMVLKNVEAAPAYNAALQSALDEIAAAAAGAAKGPMHRREAFVFLSSPGAVTPFHMDPEHNILMQIEGTKEVFVYPAEDYEMTPPALHEIYHAGGHRNLAYRPEFEATAVRFELQPGDAVYIPVKAPHRVKVGADVSVSFSITWRSRASDGNAHLHHANRRLRKIGFSPPAPGAAPARDAVKIFAHRTLSRLGLR